MKRAASNYPNRIKYTFIAAAGILLVLSIFSYERVEQQKNSAEWVERAYFVKLKLKEAFSSLRDAEAVQSAYLLTRDSALLEQFVTSISAIPPVITQLDSLLMQKDQKNDLQVFAGILQRRIVRLNEVIDSADNLDGKHLYAFLMESRTITDKTRTLMSMMERREDTMLADRMREKESQEALASLFIFLFSLSSLSILVYSFFQLRKENILRSQSEINAAVLEDMVVQRTAEILKINEQLNAQNAELERKNEELSSFTYIASHDLKEPLRKIAVFTDRINKTEAPVMTEDGRKFLERIHASIQRMQNLIDSVFSYARAETDAVFEKTDLSEIARQAVDLLEENIEEKGAEVTYENLPEVTAIRNQIEQLFVNLISNSLKYSRPGVTPRINITGEAAVRSVNGNGKTLKGWNLTFSDNGIGFDEQYKDKIFQIFQRLHGHDEYTGTGIGLAICKKIAENHGGFIEARSEKNKGATFTVFIPVHEITPVLTSTDIREDVLPATEQEL